VRLSLVESTLVADSGKDFGQHLYVRPRVVDLVLLLSGVCGADLTGQWGAPTMPMPSRRLAQALPTDNFRAKAVHKDTLQDRRNLDGGVVRERPRASIPRPIRSLTRLAGSCLTLSLLL